MAAGDYNTQTGAKNKYNTVTGKLVSTSSGSSSGGGSSGGSSPTVKPANDPSNKYNTQTGAINTNYSGYVAPSSSSNGSSSGSSASTTNTYSTVDGHKLGSNETYVDSSGRTVKEGTPIGTFVSSTASTPASSTSTTSFSGSSTLLQNGSTGQAVTDLQNRLISLGYSVGSTGADGKFGPATETAVKKFQTDNNITSDGKVGPQTNTSLNTPKSNPTPATPPTVTPTPSPVTPPVTPPNTELNLNSTVDGHKLTPGETYTDVNGKIIKEGTPIGTFQPATTPVTPVDTRNDETAHNPTNVKSPYYGATLRSEATERQDATIIGGTAGSGIQAAAVSSKIIDATFMKNEITAHPDVLAFYVNAMTYGGYTVGDILNDMKRREMIYNKDPKAIGMEAIISSSLSRDSYLATPEGKKSIIDTSSIIPTFNLQGQLDPEMLKYGANMPDEMFKVLTPILDPKSQEFKDAVEQVKSIFYDLENAKLQATSEQEKTLADTNYADFKEQLNKKYGIVLSDDASKAWGQLETLADTYNTRGLSGSGMEAEARDDSLKGIRLTDQRNRDQKLTDEEAKMASVYQSSATPEQIQALIAEDQAKGLPKEQWRAYKWGLIPSDSFKNEFSIASLKEKYPDATPEAIQMKHDAVLDQYGNYRSGIYSKYYTGLSTNYTAEKDVAGASVTAKALAADERKYRDYTSSFSQTTGEDKLSVGETKGITTNTQPVVTTNEYNMITGTKLLPKESYVNAQGQTITQGTPYTPSPTTSTTPTTPTTPNLSAASSAAGAIGKNLTSKSTRDIQTFLGNGLAIDNDYGPNTTAAVKAYQTASGLTPDGIFGPLTLAKMFPNG